MANPNYAAAARAKRSGLIDLLLRYNPVARKPALGLMSRFSRADQTERQRLMEHRTAEVIRRAAATAYGRQFGLDYTDWPILDKARIRDAPEDFAAHGAFRIPAATGGTTGVPLALVRSVGNVAAEQAFLDGMISFTGHSWATAKIAVLRGDDIKPIDDDTPPYGVRNHFGRRLVLSSAHLSAERLHWYLDALSTFRPDLLFMYPTTAANLLMLLGAMRRTLAVPLVVMSSEHLAPGVRAELAAEWGAQVIDFYGLAERTALAVSMAPDEYLFQPAYGRVELQLAEEDEIIDGCRAVAIISTGYWNPAMPLVRYDSGDRALVPADIDQAGLEQITLGLRPFHGISGRSDEFIFRPDGVRIAGLNQVPRGVPHLLQAQIVQEALDRVTIRVLALPGLDDSDRARLAANARAKIPSSIHLTIERTDRLETTRAGKTPFVIRRIGAPAPG